MPKVSVIIPTYNHARYLPDAIESVLGQSFADWEAIVVDDGSRDDTSEVMGRFGDSRLRYVWQENRGLSGARNTGITRARGEHIALLDADDIWEPAFLERSVALLERSPDIGATYCGFRYMDAAGNLLPQSVMKMVSADRFRNELLLGNWLSPGTVLVRASLYRTAGPFDEALRACEDFDMWLRMSVDHSFAGFPDVLLRYRRVGDNMSDDVDRMAKALFSVLQKHLGSLEEPVATWTELKRNAVSTIFNMRVQGYLAQGRTAESAESFLWLLQHRPNFASSLDLWYSLACVHQPVGLRGDFATWRRDRGMADVIDLLDALKECGVPAGEWRYLYGRAHLALAWLNYGQGDPKAARRHIITSVRRAPAMARDSSWIRLAGRLMPGMTQTRRLVRHLAGSLSRVPQDATV